MIDAVIHALEMALAMGWEILWPLILGFALSAVVQAAVSHQQMSRLLPDDRRRSIATAIALGAASSSSSYAAVALARSIFRKGAHSGGVSKKSRVIGSFPKRAEAIFSGVPRRVDPHSSEAHFSGMVAVLKRLLTLSLALAFLVGTTGQLVPTSMAAPQMTVSGDMAGGCAGSPTPCSGHMPNCLDQGGCITVSALPASPSSIAVPVEWTSLDYDFAPQALAGISIKPELSPPILAA